MPDLDDHRHHHHPPPAMPRADTGESTRSAGTRRGTNHSLTQDARAQYLQVAGMDGAMRGASPIARDFENAIIDDEGSGIEEDFIDSPKSARITNHRSHARMRDNRQRSRDSSSSASSSSSDNSVDAFAKGARRGRANTTRSTAASDLNVNLQRTTSGGTHGHRPTLTGGSIIFHESGDEKASFHEPAEDDVCFPQDEPSSSSLIDFEELDEFQARCERLENSGARQNRQRLSFSCQGNKPKLTANGQVSKYTEIPKIVAQSPSETKLSSGSTFDIELSGLKNVDPAPAISHLDILKAQPDRFSFFSSEHSSTIHAPTLGDLLTPGETFRELFALPPDSGVWWLDVQNPTEDEINTFQHGFGIHRLTAEDIATQEAREKVELFNQYYFVSFRSFTPDNAMTDENYLEPLSVYMVVFRHAIITVTHTSSPHAANVRARIGKLRDYMALTADWICYALIDNIVDSFGPPISGIETESDTIEDEVFIARIEDRGALLKHIGLCRKNVMSLMRLLGGKADVIKGFAKRCNESYSVTPRGEIGLYLGDIQDHVITMMSNLQHVEKMLSRSHSNYLAQLSVQNIEQGNKANNVLSKVTLLASILVPLNLVCGLFGMNVPVPGRESGTLTWFFGILAGLVGFTVVALGVAKAKRFI